MTMSDMPTESPAHAKRAPGDSLTPGQRAALRLAIALVIAGMVIGFLSSFVTLYDAAADQHWRYPALLPLAVDSGILAYVLLDHLAIALGARSRWLHLVAIALAAFTVWANAAVAPAASDTWRSIHAAMPALWVLGVEALRFTWRRLHETETQQAERIPAARWLIAPARTAGMRKRMVMHHVTSYPEAVAREEARVLGMDLAVAVFGKRWKREAPALLRHHLLAGTLPADVAVAAAEGSRELPDKVEAWVTGASGQRDRAAARARQEKQAIDRPADPSPDGQKTVSGTRRKTVSATARKRAQVTRLLTVSPEMSLTEVARKAGVSESTVVRVKREMPRALRPVRDGTGAPPSQIMEI
jgi:Protein of unknown function (DUF2637)